MLAISPVFHPHYAVQDAMALMVLLWLGWQQADRAGGGGFPRLPAAWLALAGLVFAAHTLTAAGIWFLRDFGLVLAAQLALWAVCLVRLRGLRHAGAV